MVIITTKARPTPVAAKPTSNDYFKIALLALSLFSTTSYAQGLNSLLHRVEQKAPQLLAAQAQADASAAGINIAKSQYWGNAQVFALANRYNNERLVNPISFPPTLTQSLFDNQTYGYGISLSLPLDIDGRIAAKVQTNQYLSQAAKQNSQQTRLLIFSRTVSLYRGLQRLEGVKMALEQQRDALYEHYRTSQTAVKIGRMAKVELLRIDAEIKSVEGAIAGLISDEIRIRSSIAALIDEISYTNRVSRLVNPPLNQHLSQNISNLVSKRPDVKAASSIMLASDKSLVGTKRAWLPKLAFKADTLHNEGVTAVGADNWSVGLQLSWQFWDGGRRSADSAKAKANKIVANQNYQGMVNQARSELTSAQASWHSASQQYEAAVAGETSAVKTETIQSDRFAEGRLSAVDLIDAEAALARARADKVSALANWWLADDQLYLASGKPPSAYQFDQQSKPNQPNKQSHLLGE